MVLGLAERLARARVPLHRIRISMRVVNPLLTAWGVSWTPETGAELYSVARAVLETSAYARSSVQHVIETRTSFRRRLGRLGPEVHTVLADIRWTSLTAGPTTVKSSRSCQ